MQLASEHCCDRNRELTLEPDHPGVGQEYRQHFVVDDRFHPVQSRVTIHNVSDRP